MFISTISFRISATYRTYFLPDACRILCKPHIKCHRVSMLVNIRRKYSCILVQFNLKQKKNFPLCFVVFPRDFLEKTFIILFHTQTHTHTHTSKDILISICSSALSMYLLFVFCLQHVGALEAWHRRQTVSST
jgi:hypothetical protein